MDVVNPASSLLQGTGYLPRVSMRDGRAVEEALAPATLLEVP